MSTRPAPVALRRIETIMLTELSVYAVLPAKDLRRARDFYRDTLGLEPSSESAGNLFYRTAGSTFLLYETDNAGTARNTQMCWETGDLDSEVAELRSKGVVFEDYDIPGLKTENGIATMGEEKAAWFKDSEGNTLCLSQSASPAP